MAQEGSGNQANDNGTPYNAPKRGPNRQERAAKVSSEVSALAADLPKANRNGRNAEVESAQPRNAGVSTQSQGKTVTPGRMGENDSPRREGPLAHGLGERGSPNKFGEPRTTGGASVMRPLGDIAEVPASSDPNAGTVEAPGATRAPTANKLTTAPAKEVKPKKPAQSPEAFLSSGSGTSTLLSSNVPGMLQDRVNILTPRSSASSTANSEIQQRLRASGNKLTAFRSKQEKDAYTKPREKLVAKLAELCDEAKKQKENGVAKLPEGLVDKLEQTRMQLREHPEFKPLPKTAQQDMINRMVLGNYDEQGLLGGKEVYKQPLLNSIARELLKNPTYLAKDSDKLLGKLKSLLPAAPAAAKKPAAKAKA